MYCQVLFILTKEFIYIKPLANDLIVRDLNNILDILYLNSFTVYIYIYIRIDEIFL